MDPEPYRRTPNIPYVGDIDRHGYRVVSIGTGQANTAVLEAPDGQRIAVPISEARA